MIATLLRGFKIRFTFSINSFFIFSYSPHLFGHLSLALAENPGPQGKLGFLDFSPIMKIDGVNLVPTEVLVVHGKNNSTTITNFGL